MKCITLLALIPAIVLAAKKENPAGKEAVERFLLAKYAVTPFHPARGPSAGGAVVQLLKPGLEASPATAITPVFSYKEGRMRKSVGTLALNLLFPIPYQSRLLITKIEARENHVLFDLVSTEPLEGIWLKAALHIEFGKGYLESPDLRAIDSTVSEVLALEQQQQRQQQQQPPPPPPQQPRRPVSEPPPPPPPPPAPAAAPAEITPGMTTDQVKATLGPPTSATKFGVKEILSYQNMKVTLVNGKVTNVE